jgi:hypothetical protein
MKPFRFLEDVCVHAAMLSAAVSALTRAVPAPPDAARRTALSGCVAAAATLSELAHDGFARHTAVAAPAAMAQCDAAVLAALQLLFDADAHAQDARADIHAQDADARARAAAVTLWRRDFHKTCALLERTRRLAADSAWREVST